MPRASFSTKGSRSERTIWIDFECQLAFKPLSYLFSLIYYAVVSTRAAIEGQGFTSSLTDSMYFFCSLMELPS